MPDTNDKLPPERIAELRSEFARGRGIYTKATLDALDELERVRGERDKLALFKKNTHILLDEAGVPLFENEECRVSCRIRWLASELAAAKAQVEAMKAAVADAKKADEHYKQQIADLQVRLGEHVQKMAGNYWHWQGDGEDYVESLTCPILISADKMRGILAEVEAMRAVVEAAEAYKATSIRYAQYPISRTYSDSLEAEEKLFATLSSQPAPATAGKGGGADPDELLRHPDGTLHQFMPKLNGKSFRCECGCNVFHKKVSDPNRFICNCCKTVYFSEE